MPDQELMSAGDIHAFGIEIVFTYLQKDGWVVRTADPLADLHFEPQIIASKDGDLAFFIVRTAVYPERGRFEEGQEAFETLVRHAKEHGADCYFASVGIANSTGTSEEDRSRPIKNASYDVEFDGLVRMELPSGQKPETQAA
jgi:hypothetical protein